MDRRKKRTSSDQYSMYIDMMEKDPIFATGKVPRDVDVNYLQKKWKQLSDKLNTCSCGPTLTAEEWRKRLNDWKNTTRCKYRRSVIGEKDISMTALEMKALALFGKVPHISATDQQSIHLKSEKDEGDEELEQRTSESFQKELQAAVEEAIGGDDDEEEDDAMGEEEQEEIVSDPIQAPIKNVGTTYRTILVANNAAFNEDDEENNDDDIEFITSRRQTIGQTTVTTSTANAGVQTMQTPVGTMTKLINGDVPLKRLRSHMHDQMVYEVKKAPVVQQTQTQPRGITLHNTNAAPIAVHQIKTQQVQQQQQLPQINNHTNNTPLIIGGNSQDTREIAKQLKRLADIKTEKLRFEIARFKFNNPGFQYNYHPS